MQSELEKGIYRYVDNSIENAPYTQVYTGLIKSSGADGYTVSLNGVEYANVPSKGTFLTNDTVRVVVPNNQYSNMFILSDSTGGGGTGAVSSVNGMTGDVVISNVDSADKLSSAKTITLSGDATGSVSTDFSTNPTVSVTVVDDSHNHIISNVDNLQTTLNVKADLVDGKVPSSQLPSLSPSLALGETSSTAYRGDRGAIAYNHSLSTSNPHSTTASQVGLGNVPNVTTNNQTPTFTMAGTDSNLVSGETLTISFGKIAKAINSLISHIADSIRHITSTERTNWNTAYTNNHTHSNKTTLDNTTASYTTAEQTKLSGIENGAEVNNISDTNATDLTDGGDTTLHYHATDRNRANHTGTQLASTISDFASTVRSTVLVGLSTATNAVISATDTVLSALGKLQKQISDNLTTLTNHTSNTSNPHSVTKAQVGLNDVPNVTTNNQTPSYTMASGNADLVSGETLTIAFGKIARSINSLIAHIADNIRHITSTERTNWNVSYTNNHIHSNKTILDNTTASYIATDKTKLDGIESGAQVNTVTGVKGDSEGSYRVGNVNITKANIGLGSVDNTADTNKNVLSATKLTTARTLSLTGDVTGSVSSDFSTNPSITTTSRKIAFVGSNLTDSNGWYKVAEQKMSGSGDTNITFMVTSTYAIYQYGILELQMRSNYTSISCFSFDWMTKKGFVNSDFIIVINGMEWSMYVLNNTRHRRICFEILSMSDISSKNMSWNLMFEDNLIKETIIPTPTVVSTENSTVGYSNKLTTARTISLTGDVTGSVSFDGSANVSITSTVADDSHNHIISNVDNLQASLNAKAPLVSPSLTGTPLAPTATQGTNTTQIATTAFVQTAINTTSSIVWN